LLAQAHYHRISPLAFPDLRRLLAAQRRLDHVLHVHYVQPVAGRALAVDLDLQLRHVARPIDEGPVDPADATDGIEHALRFFLEGGKVVAEYFDDDLAIDLRDALDRK